jgi:integration host factor subunit beta
MSTITKKELTDRIADSTKMNHVVVKGIVQRFLDEIISELASGNRLEFRDFGVFEVRTRRPRMAQNPRTLERVPVPGKRTVRFKVGRLMKARIQDTKADAGWERRTVEVSVAPDAPSAPPSVA